MALSRAAPQNLQPLMHVKGHGFEEVSVFKLLRWLALRVLSVSSCCSLFAEMAGEASGSAAHIDHLTPPDDHNSKPGSAADSEDESAEVEISDSGSQDGLFQVREPIQMLSHQLIIR